MTFPKLTRRQVWEHLPNERGRALVPLSWTFTALDALDDSNICEVLLWCERQSGKSQWMAAAAASELLCIAGSYSIFIAAAEHQAEAVFLRKLRRPLERLARELGLDGEIKFTRSGIEIPAFGSALEVLPANAATAPGRTPTKIFF